MTAVGPLRRLLAAFRRLLDRAAAAARVAAPRAEADWQRRHPPPSDRG